MLSLKNTRKKIQNIFKQNRKNIHDIFQKQRDYFHELISNPSFKVPTTIYDSGWVKNGSLNGTTNGSHVITSVIDSTPKTGQRLPLYLYYNLEQDIEISEEHLPFIKPLFLIKDYPKMQVEGMYDFEEWYYASNYYQIKGDSTILYQGYTPSHDIHSEYSITQNSIPLSHTSKWYYGTLKYSLSGGGYELRESYITKVFASNFICSAIDLLSQAFITGEGSWWDGAQWVLNTTKTVAIFGGNQTEIWASGKLYKNDIYQQTYSIDNPYHIVFSTIDATLVDFGYEIATVDVEIDDKLTASDVLRLWYSDKRAKQFKYNLTTNLLENLPDTSDYETAILPYSNITVKMNPDGYPEIATHDTPYRYSSQKRGLWVKKSDTRHSYHIAGQLILSTIAKKETVYSTPIMDESYSPSGITYVRDSENRDSKDMPYYTLENVEIEVRLILTLDNPNHYSNIRKYEI